MDHVKEMWSLNLKMLIITLKIRLNKSTYGIKLEINLRIYMEDFSDSYFFDYMSYIFWKELPQFSKRSKHRKPHIILQRF